MKALFLSPNVPYPPENGGHQRNLGLIRCLARVAQVQVLAIGDPNAPRNEEARQVFSRWGATLEVFQPTGPDAREADVRDTQRLPDAAAHFRSPELVAALEHLTGTTRFDLVHVEEVVMAQYAEALACPRVLDRQKVDWSYHAAMADVAPALAGTHLAEAARFRRWETQLPARFDHVLVPGIGDRRQLEPLWSVERISIVPVAIADELRPPADEGSRRVTFVLLYGAQDYGPNVEAQEWFFREVWPRLSAAAPELRVRIVGSGRPPLRAQPPPADPRVEVLGFVPDIARVLCDSGVLVVPVHVGGGVRTKVLEALACGLPVVSTALGVENLGLVDGRHYLAAETGEEMAGAILRLVADPDLARRLGRIGSTCVEDYRWSRIGTDLEALYREVAAAGQRPRAASLAPTLAVEDFERETEAIERRLRTVSASSRGRLAPLRDRLLLSGAGRWITRRLEAALRPGVGRRPAGLCVRLMARALVRLSRLCD